MMTVGVEFSGEPRGIAALHPSHASPRPSPWYRDRDRHRRAGLARAVGSGPPAARWYCDGNISDLTRSLYSRKSRSESR